MRDYEPILSQLMLLMARETRFRCRPGLSQVLAENKRLVVALSHGSPLSWLPAISLLNVHVCARGGGDRRPVGVMDRLFFQVPGIRALAVLVTQSDRSLSFFEIYNCFEKGEFTDLVVFPEGSNCFFGDPNEIQEFRSPRFVELAIRTKTPLLIGVHHGSEMWARALNVKPEVVDHLEFLPKFAFEFLERRLRKNRRFTLPLWPKAMERFEMLCELYHPVLKCEDLDTDEAVRGAQIRAESELIRERMKGLMSELRAQAPSLSSGASFPVV